MRKLLLFLGGLLLMVLMFGTMVISGAIYDTGGKTTVEPYFFQPNDSYRQRLGVPAAPADLGDESMRNRLIAKYITEMFYVIPDVTNAQQRMNAQTSLRTMSTRVAFEKWQKNIAPEIEKLAQQRSLRTVSVLDITPQANSEYQIVQYETKTWYVPNNMAADPEIKRDVIYLKIAYKPGMWEQVRGKSIEEYLEDGGDPAAVFLFGVEDFVTMDE